MSTLLDELLISPRQFLLKDTMLPTLHPSHCNVRSLESEVMQKPKIFAVAAIASLASAMPAHAYIDPGTGTLIVQSLIGGAAAAMTVASVYMTKIRDTFRRLTGGESGDKDPGQQQ